MPATHELRRIGQTLSVAIGRWFAPPQAAALCLRIVDGKPQILLVSNKAGTRWGIPKGHIEPGETSYQAACREAFEEAGVLGVVSHTSIGHYRYSKSNETRRRKVTVHVLRVETCLDAFPEATLRASRWLSPVEAAGLIGYEELAGLLSDKAILQEAGFDCG
jgi:8-oxo-dGTP pyrophosphatase MutT (NUDIX family)